jgi:hypothetical protein
MLVFIMLLLGMIQPQELFTDLQVVVEEEDHLRLSQAKAAGLGMVEDLALVITLVRQVLVYL